MKESSIHYILHFFNTLLFFFVILLQTCLTKFESIKLKCYFTTLLYAIAVNMLCLEFSLKNGLSFNYTFDGGKLNQYRGEIGSFYNRPTSQITELTIFLINILLKFAKNVLVYVILYEICFF